MDGTTNDAPLAGLLPRLAADPALTAVVGSRDARLAVPASARPAVLAALAHAADRRPLVVAVPTVEEAERTVADLEQFLPASAVAHFPAWETLPFERVSPSTETMGLRLSAMWRLRTGDPTLRIVVATARALVQRLGPHVEDTEPVVVRPGDQVDSQDLVRRLVEAGYRREYQVEHRGEVAVRGSIVDVFPSTAEVPVRIDLWGDEVDRLCEVSVADQRAGTDVPELVVLPARELLPTPEVQARAEALLGAEPWGREQWQRLADGETFEGMESWLAWLSPDEHVLFDLVGDDGLIEAKAPRAKNHVDTILAGEIPAAYMAQLQTGLFVSGREWVDYVSFSGGLHLWTKRVVPQPEWQAVILDALAYAEAQIADRLERYKAATDGLPLTDPLPTFDDLITI